MNSTISSLVTRAVCFITWACARLSSLSVNPLFSSLLTLHILLFLYFPPFLLKLVYSPVTILAFLILVALLCAGSPRGDGRNPNPKQEEPLFGHGREYGFGVEPAFRGSSACFVDDSFVEWDVKAPLEVIYEGEEAGEECKPSLNKAWRQTSSLETDSDSESSSEGELGLNSGGGWGEEEGLQPFEWEGEEMIEIELDFGGVRGGDKVYEDLHAEEENMIEIDLSVGND